EALRSGSDFVLKRVYEENRAKFLNYARRYSLSEADNLYIYQDAFVIFYNNVMGGKIQKFTSSISTYLFSIGKHLIYDRMRKRNKTVNFEESGGMAQYETDLEEPIEIEMPGVAPELEELYTQFSTLGKKCQELLTLFYYRGFTITEIMEALQYNNENVVKAAKSRCVKTLRERMGPQTDL
ncbi:MAG: RNA polymerase sigma factor, partial [Flavobacteriaceae bacterium]